MSDTIESLKKRLISDTQDLKTLKALLEQEKGLLASSQIQELEPLTNRKNDLLNRIRESARQKIHLLVQIGFRPDQGEPSRFIASLGDEGLLICWQGAHQALVDCQFHNEVNGRIVSHLQRRVSRLSDIIRGKDMQPALYGASGKQQHMGGGHILASA